MSIYFYHLPKQNLVKIGCSSNVNKRLNQLSTGCTEQGVLLRVIEGFGFKAEKWLHEHFKALKVKGEWFNYSEEMLSIEIPDGCLDTIIPLLHTQNGFCYQIPNKGLVIFGHLSTREDFAIASKFIIRMYKLYGIPLLE